jgi:signal transduction histidine kinase
VARVSVSLAFRGNVVELTVCDNGRGISREPPGDGFHFGLSGMCERARAPGTRLEVDSAK